MNIGSADVPFEQCDADSQSVNSTGDTVSALFTNLAFAKGRALMIQNRGGVDLLMGKSSAGAVWHILPGSIATIYPRDLAKVFLKSSGAAVTVDVFLVV